ncbi:hypothetical protein BHM03_00007378 [Ensete ventricosum]|nr:hypothetical protein BHM03_00007378 [Ensete ventricosum]
MTHALAGYANPQTMKVEGFLKQRPVTILIESRRTNNFMNNKGQKIIVDFFLPLDDYEAVLGIEWLSTIGDVSWNFSKLTMKFFSKEKQVILRGKRWNEVTTIATQCLEKVPQKESSGFGFLTKIQELQELKPKEIEDTNSLPQLVEISGASTKPSRLLPTRLHDLRMLSDTLPPKALHLCLQGQVSSGIPLQVEPNPNLHYSSLSTSTKTFNLR